jgi:hypothetical protein
MSHLASEAGAHFYLIRRFAPTVPPVARQRDEALLGFEDFLALGR